MPHLRAVGNAGAGGTGRTGPSARLWGAAPPTPPSRRSARCAPLGGPTHPPSGFLSVGAEPPRPRRISARGVAFAGAPNSRWRPAPSPLAGERAGVRGAPRASAARWSRTPRSDRRRVLAPRLPERLPRGSASIGTQDTSQGPHTPIPEEAPAHPPAPDSSFMWGLFRSRREDTSQGPHAPDRTMARLSPSLTAPCSSSRREGAGPPSRLVQKARSAPFRRRFAKVSRGRELA